VQLYTPISSVLYMTSC